MHVRSHLCLGGPVSMPEAGWESVETLRHVGRSRSSWCVSSMSNACQQEGALLAVASFYAVVAGRLARRGVAGSFLSMSINCNTETLGLNWLYPEGFQTLTSQRPGEGLNCEMSFPVHYRYLATWKSPRFIIQKTFKMGAGSFMWVESLWHQKRFDREESSPRSNLEDSDVTVFAWVMTFTSEVRILKLFSSQRLMLP